ncbi:MAG: hypothetical protein ACFCVG_11650 [Kineosporiaceae bacterium]
MFGDSSWESAEVRSRELRRLLDATGGGPPSLETLAAALADYAATAPHRLTERLGLPEDADAA